ncbi:peptidylprolyl isomerase [bacterium]|nr:peptidylprolyl isomerase [bacterium]
MQIQDNCVVSIHYTLTDDTGARLDSSEGTEPLTYLHGLGQLIPGLENELTGKIQGDQFQIAVQPHEAYGEYDKSLVQLVPHNAFEEVGEIYPGMQFQTNGPDGHPQIITIQEVNENGVTVDGNHPLAGKVLHFDITVGSVRSATAEEIAHGHAH